MCECRAHAAYMLGLCLLPMVVLRARRCLIPFLKIERQKKNVFCTFLWSTYSITSNNYYCMYKMHYCTYMTRECVYRISCTQLSQYTMSVLYCCKSGKMYTPRRLNRNLHTQRRVRNTDVERYYRRMTVRERETWKCDSIKIDTRENINLCKTSVLSIDLRSLHWLLFATIVCRHTHLCCCCCFSILKLKCLQINGCSIANAPPTALRSI